MNENNKIDLLTLEKLSKLARLDFNSKSAEKLIEDYKDEKPKARCGYFTVHIIIKGWDSDGNIDHYGIDITEAICKLTGDTYRKDGTIKVGSSSSQGWSFSGHLEDRIMRSL